MKSGRGLRLALVAFGLLLLTGLLAWHAQRQAPAWQAVAQKMLKARAPGASWRALRFSLWPQPALVIHELHWRASSVTVTAPEARLVLDAGALLLRGRVRPRRLRLLRPEITWRRGAPAMPPLALEVIYGRVHWRRMTLTDVFLSFARDRGEVRWDGRARLGRGSVRSFGTWPFRGGRGYATLRLEHAPLALFARAFVPADALADGALALRRTGSGWDARWEFRVDAGGRRWAHTRGRVTAKRDRVQVDEAFVHLKKGAIRVSGGCARTRNCRVRAKLVRFPAFVLGWFWPEGRLPARFAGAMDGMLGLTRSQAGWNMAGEIRPRSLALGWQENALPVPEGPWHVHWGSRKGGEIAWREGRIAWQVQRGKQTWEFSAHEVSGARLAALLLSRLDLPVHINGKADIWVAITKGKRGTRLEGRWNLVHAEVVAGRIRKPREAPARCGLRYERRQERVRIALSECHIPGLEVARLRASWSGGTASAAVPWLAAHVAGLHWDASEARRAGLHLPLPYGGRAHANRLSFALWKDGRMRAEGVLDVSGLRVGNVHASCHAEARDKRFHLSQCALSLPGFVWDGEIRGSFPARYAHVHTQRVQAALPAWTESAWPNWAQAFRRWRVDVSLAHAEITAAPDWVVEDARGVCHWAGDAWNCTLRSQWAGGELRLEDALLEPRAKGWLVDARLHLQRADLAHAQVLHALLDAELAGRLDLHLWFRLRTPVRFSGVRASGDLAVYGMRYHAHNHSLAARKLEARIYANGKRLRVEPLKLWLAQNRVLAGRIFIMPDGTLAGEIADDATHWNISGTLQAPETARITEASSDKQ